MPKKNKNVHYVNNAEFSLSVVNYVKTVSEAKENNDNRGSLAILSPKIQSKYCK